ncbi:MAG: relaxase domain-containing protein [Hyphomonadaceae bacterium]|nr:relaxase domain-containing protein [Hyphomonadaceae bacterium]
MRSIRSYTATCLQPGTAQGRYLGAIVSRELYKAQKRAGAAYRSALARELERAGYAVERSADSFRIAVIPHDVERAFSKRRKAIEVAGTEHGYRSPRRTEPAALRTRRTKRDVHRAALYDAWRAEARDLGFEFRRDAPRAYVGATASPLDASAIDRRSAGVAIRSASFARRDAQACHGKDDRRIAGNESACSHAWARGQSQTARAGLQPRLIGEMPQETALTCGVYGSGKF